MNFIKVDKNKCTQCGLCVNVCREAIGMGNHGPEVIKQQCIACGHCVAVCPNDALDNINSPFENQTAIKEIPRLDADMAADFLRARRSIRSYKKMTVPREKIKQLLDIARFAPSACNSQGVSYLVIDNPDTLSKITEVTIQWAEEKYKNNSLPSTTLAVSISSQVDNYHKNGTDVVLRSAPCLIIAMAEKNTIPMGRDNTHFSLTYAQLLAQTIGLGTCWAGLFEFCANDNYLPLHSILNLPENMSITGGLMVGYPKYTYKRLVDRNTLQVTWE